MFSGVVGDEDLLAGGVDRDRGGVPGGIAERAGTAEVTILAGVVAGAAAVGGMKQRAADRRIRSTGAVIDMGAAAVGFVGRFAGGGVKVALAVDREAGGTSGAEGRRRSRRRRGRFGFVFPGLNLEGLEVLPTGAEHIDRAGKHLTDIEVAGGIDGETGRSI